MNIAKLMGCYCPEPTESDEHIGLLWDEHLEAWRIWEKQAAHGSGELRSIAISLLEDCDEREDVYLSLDSLGLTSLPPCIPKFVETLDVSNNKLESLPHYLLPPALKELYADNNHFKKLPPQLPGTLISLSIAHNRLKQFPTLPAGLQQFNAADNQITSLPKFLPDALQVMHVQNNRISHVSMTPPPALHTLSIYGNPLNELPASWAIPRVDALLPGPSSRVCVQRGPEINAIPHDSAESPDHITLDTIYINSRPNAARHNRRFACAPRWALLIHPLIGKWL
ncbi:hypothetical protein ABK905_22995 [Acerihabitans sp. KWT182]|uniref:Leucine-rich repeat domain-containing protein n=1 Tax=Acerihabitans sp. KWT182 TaxID=3157919 RepID=A0AAU7Q8D7_9GAMM